MAEKIISPGVFTNEIDQTFLPAAVADIGAAIIGPTPKGPAGIPTVVTSYSDYQAKFGDVVTSGSSQVQYLTSHAAREYLQSSDTLTVVRILDGSFGPATATINTGSLSVQATGSGQTAIAGNSVESFTLSTLADGTLLNNASTDSTTNNVLTNGTGDNVRYEVSNISNNKGTFTLSIRAGNDNIKRKQVLESFTGVNLDPNSPNYLAKVVGDQKQEVGTDGTTKYLKLVGDYPNKSRYVRVSNIPETSKTPDYLDENGNVRVPAASASLPEVGSGSNNGGFSGGTNGYVGLNRNGTASGNGLLVGTGSLNALNFYENITADTQGYNPTDLTTADGGAAYSQALDLLANQDEFDINLILVPGLVHNVHSAVTNKVIDVCESRGDCFAIIDPVVYDKNPSDAVTEAEAVNSNFAAMFS